MDEKKPDPHWPAWFYGPKGEAGTFDRKEDVPKGWADSPAKPTKAEKQTDNPQ